MKAIGSSETQNQDKEQKHGRFFSYVPTDLCFDTTHDFLRSSSSQLLRQQNATNPKLPAVTIHVTDNSGDYDLTPVRNHNHLLEYIVSIVVN